MNNIKIKAKSKSNRMRTTLSLLILLLSIQIFGQTSILTGTVKDENNEELIGVNVTLSSTNAGTITDINGKFTLTVPKNVTEIKVSYIGYTAQTITIKGKTNINVILASDNRLLDEVVVVGYGQMRKSDITGAVSSVKISDSEANTATSLQNLIQGRAAGVQITAGDAAPGSAINMKIRGTSSLTGGSEPLYVVDGIIMNSASQDTRSSGAGGGATQSAQNGLTGISPQDIENMEILKDASATAIYGSMGANGVVLITTKKGKSEKPRVQYIGSLSQSNIANKRKVLNLTDYLEFWSAMNPTGVTLDEKNEVNWQDEQLRTALSQNHRVTIAGKTDKTNYYVAAGFLNNNGIIKNTGVNQGDFRVNLNQVINKNINIGSNTSFSYMNTSMTFGADTRSSSNSGLLRSMIIYRPYLTKVDIDNADGNFDENLTNPSIWSTDFNDESKEYRVLSSMFLNVKLNKWLSMRTTAGLDYRSKTRQQWFGLPTYQGLQVGGLGTYSTLDALRYNIDHVFNFNVQKKKHRFDGTAGITAVGSPNLSNLISSRMFNGNVSLQEEGLMYGTNPSTPSYGESLTTTLSGFGRLVYSFDNKYILTSTFRADGTSKFAPGSKFSYFPSFALAYRVMEEKFMRNINVISNLKLRLGWGQVGNQGISPYQTQVLYNGTIYANSQNNGYVTGTALAGIANPTLKWETTNQYNAGADLGFFDNRVNFTIDLYNKQSSDLLQNIDLPLNAGSSRIWVNRGIIENKGLELSTDLVIVKTKNTSLNLAGSISFNRNKIVNIGLPVAMFGTNNWAATYGSVIGFDTRFKQPANIFIEGYPVAQFFGHKIDGIVSLEEQALDYQTRMDNYMALNPTADPGSLTEAQLSTVPGVLPYYNDGGKTKLLVAGDPKWVDISGDGMVESTDKDKTLIGDPNPEFTYGFTLDFKHKDFFINAVFNGVYGNDIANGNRMFEERLKWTGLGTPTNITQRAWDNRWTEENQQATYPRINFTGDDGLFSNFIIEDGSFLRLSSLSAGYTFRFKSKSISSLGLSLTTRNLFVLTKYTGYDPEVTSFMNDWSRVGIDWGSYPNSHTTTLGVTIDF